MIVDAAVTFFTSEEQRHKSYPVVSDDGRLVGMASRADILQWRREAPTDEDTLSDRLSDEALIVGYADETVAQLADRMAAESVGRVAIVERGTMRLVGLVSRKDLLHIRRAARTAEDARIAYFRAQRPAAGQSTAALPDRRSHKKAASGASSGSG